MEPLDALVTAGLSASILSTAHDGDQGGDMHYVSVCKRDYLTRIAIADLRGHGGQSAGSAGGFIVDGGRQ
jgi:hypothetical protein